MINSSPNCFGHKSFDVKCILFMQVNENCFFIAEFRMNCFCANFLVLLNQTPDDEPSSTTGKQNQWQSRPISEWTPQQVCHWLMGMNMEQYIAEFTTRSIDGQQLMLLDSDKLKVSLCSSSLHSWVEIGSINDSG